MNRPLPGGLTSRPRKSDIGYEPDACWTEGGQKVWVEVKSGTHSFRNVRASLLGLAYLLSREPDSRALLVLPDSRITEDRLRAEVRLAEQTLRPEVMGRLSLVLGKDHGYFGIPDDLDKDFQLRLDGLIKKESPDGAKPRQFYYGVVAVMVHEWLLGHGPVTTDWLMKTVGCSYPTAARALQRLAHQLVRYSDRRAALRRFPREEWARFVTVAGEVRTTLRYADRSGQARSAHSLLRRLEKLGRSDVAVGGVEGARHYDPEIDLVGLPRLDLTLHCPDRRVDLSFVEQLDPALKETAERDAPASLVVHLLRRKASLFQPGDGGLQWADPVECLLDLHEARLEPQAKAFVNSLVKRNRKDI